MNVMLETPSRVWRRIEEQTGDPSLPSLPAFDVSGEPQEDDTDSINLDLSNDSDPVHSTPAAYSAHSMSTVRAPLSVASTARFAHSIASRSSKSGSGLSASRSSTTRPQAIPPMDYSFDASVIPSLPHAPYDSEIRSSDQDTSSRGSSLGDPLAHLEQDDLDISEALHSIGRPDSPPLPSEPEPTPRKKYDYSVSLRSEPKPSPYDKLRNVNLRRPLSRNTRTPSLTRTGTPSDSSSSTHSTPRSPLSVQQDQSPHASPIAALAIPLPRSATASPMLPSRGAVSASPMPARLVPLPPSARNSPLTTHSPRFREQSTVSNSDAAGPSLPSPCLSFGSEEHTNTHETTSEKEPTFTSEEGSTKPDSTADDTIRNVSPYNRHVSPAPPSSAPSSPAPSAMLTPTPAYVQRRPRFNVMPLQKPTTPSEAQEEREEAAAATATTQATPTANANATAHKRSFLMSLINSTARPRTRPRHSLVPATPGAGANLPAAFAGVTPGPRAALSRRMSHPLAQEWKATSNTSDSGEESPSGKEGVDHVSFLSTTSSQDLVIHARANTSFDPAMGLGDRGHGVNRFNAGKLNNYLHGLNKRLQEENEGLVERLREYEEKLGKFEAGGSGTSGYDEPIQSQGQRRTSSGGGRRVSAGPLGLNAVAEADNWTEEKAELEEVISELTEQLGKASEDKEAAERLLSEEKAERARDREKWRERMGEVERGVQDIVDDIYQKLRASEERAVAAEKEKKEAERRVEEVRVERDVLAERVGKAEGALEGNQDLGGAVNAANERVSNVLADLKNANLQIRELEEEAVGQDERIEGLERELGEEKKLVMELEEELQLKSEELQSTLQRIDSLQSEVKDARGELQEEKAIVAELERANDAAVERIETLEELLGSTQERLAATTEVLDQEREKALQFEAEADRANQLAAELEEAMDAGEEKMRADEEAIAALTTKLASLERELDRSRSHDHDDADADIAALEAELEDAHKQIARLNVLVSQSPARKAVEKAKDAKIEMLEQERDDLVERLKALKSGSLGTPGRSFAGMGMGISPMHRHILNLSLKSPKTPGGPLRDLSWLQTPMKDLEPGPLLAHIEQLQHELDKANESIDDKLDRLEDAGHGVVSLTNQLQDARDRVISLENEVARLGRREERKNQRLERLRCGKCGVKVDTREFQQRPVGDESSYVHPEDCSGPSSASVSPSRSSDKLRADLQAVNAQLATMKQQWESERRKLLGENANLKSATNRLNAEVRQAMDDRKRYSETERGKVGMQAELEKARRTVEDLEAQLKAERSRLRTFATEQTQAEREKDEVALQLRRTESDMAEIREELLRIKNENHELEAELRVNSTAEQKTRLLEAKVVENAETIEQLRRERSLLVSDHKDLQKQFSEVTKRLGKLREQHSASQTSHEQRRHELDLQLLEIDDLRKIISEQADGLQQAEEERNRAATEKTDMTNTVAVLEADLRRVKRDAEAFGRDLKLLKSQKERLEESRKEDAAKADRAQKQAQTQIRLLKEEAKEERGKTRALQDQWNKHVCAADSAQGQVSDARHKAECKGLVLQINYLKAKWVRESNLRDNLGNQKQYLLVLLAKSERMEEKILAAIAKIGFPHAAPRLPPPTRPKWTLKKVTLSVVFVLRAQRAKNAWQVERAKKAGIPEALAEVRRHRAIEPPRAKDKGKQRATS